MKNPSKRPMSEEHKAKIRAALVGRPFSLEHRERMSAAAQNRTAEHRAALGKAHKGTHLTAQHKAAISAGNKGREFTAETRAKISAALTGKPQASRGNLRHGMKGSPAYNVWMGMRTRCLNPKNPNWPYYGGRGIKIAPQWDSFLQFLADVGPRPANTPGYLGKFSEFSLDRIDNDGNYEPGNVRWVTRDVQVANRRCSNCVKMQARVVELEALLALK